MPHGLTGFHGTFPVDDGTVLGGVGGVVLLGAGFEKLKLGATFISLSASCLPVKMPALSFLILPAAGCRGPNHGGLPSPWRLTPQ